MKSRNRHNGWQLHLVLWLLLILANSAAGEGRGPDDETCLGCHDGLELSLNKGPHQLSSQLTSPATEIGCADCHQGGDVHAEDPSVDNIGQPGRMLAADVKTVCGTCHQPHQGGETFGLDPHYAQDLSCTSCHAVHSDSQPLLADDDDQFCGNCHIAVLNDFLKRSNHPVADGQVSCLSCHDFTGRAEPTIGHGANSNCVSCHPDQSGPFMFEHEPTSSFSTEAEGCTACHFPHGSPNDRLLTQANDRLCQQCHFEATSHTATAHGGQYAGHSCMDCHSEVHGSFEPSNKFLLDPDLGLKLGGTHNSCYCHGRNQ